MLLRKSLLALALAAGKCFAAPDALEVPAYLVVDGRAA
jgi:hypothetical protein